MNKGIFAVVAADMVGFSRLMQEDETNTILRQKKYFKEIINPDLNKFNGKIIKTTGDGFLAIFENNQESLDFSFEVQSKIIKEEKLIIPDKKIWYRFGIHFGEIILEDNDVFGNVVNIASRLESISDSGGISFSKKFFETINSLKYKVINTGLQVLKNIKNPIEVLTINLNKNKDTLQFTESDQQIKYCLSYDKTTIAYAKFGKGNIILKAPNFMTSLEHDWRSPIWKHFFKFFANEGTFVRFDQRGNGLSDWSPPEITFEKFVEDLHSVVMDLNIENFPLFALSQGCAVSIAYAVKYPSKVSKLILLGGYARGRANRLNNDEYKKISDLEEMMILNGWENNNPQFRQFFASGFMPDASKEQMDSFNDIMKYTTSAINAAKIQKVNDQIDVVNLLSKLDVPTLIFHADNDARVPISEGRFLAANIKNSKFINLKSKNHVLLEDEKAWEIFKIETLNFLK